MTSAPNPSTTTAKPALATYNASASQPAPSVAENPNVPQLVPSMLANPNALMSQPGASVSADSNATVSQPMPSASNPSATCEIDGNSAAGSNNSSLVQSTNDTTSNATKWLKFLINLHSRQPLASTHNPTIVKLVIN